MKKYIAFGTALIASLTMHAQTAAQAYVKVLEGSEELRDAVWGVLAVKVNGDTVACYRPNTRMLPASNTKLITTGLALNEFGENHRFSTHLAYTGEIKNGVLDGDLYIVGGGDPTIASGDSISIHTKDLFARWEKMVRSAGIKKIDGRIIGDGRYLDGETEHLSWEIEDVGYDYAPGGNGLCFYENIAKFKITPGKLAGDAVGVESVYPKTPWITLSTPCVTAEKGTGNDLYYVTTDMAPVAEMRGTIEAGRKPFTMSCSNKYGALTCAYYFYKHLNDSGIVAKLGPAEVDSRGYIRDFSGDKMPKAVAFENMNQIGVTQSPTLFDIIRKTNYDSDNFYAESLLRLMSKVLTGSACYDSCAVARSIALDHIGVETEKNVRIKDGSGLSREDYISPEFFVDFLKHMRATPVWDAYLHSLPQPTKGTLTTRLRTAPSSVKSRIYMKSGSMGGVRCFSGYIIPTGGDSSQTIIFSVLTNNAIVDVSRINFCLDKLIGLMAEENK